MKIVFYGASVTNQSQGNGYFDHVKFNLLESGHESVRFAFSACHFDDAGFYNVPELLAHKPDVVVFEWNTTGLNVFDSYKFSYFLGALHKLGAIVAFLILPRKSTNFQCDRDCEIEVLNYAKTHGLPLLDIRKSADLDLSKHLRDDVHTTPLGGIFYADQIFSWLMDFLHRSSTIYSGWLPKVGSFPSIYKYNIKKVVSKELFFRATIKGSMPEVAIAGLIGPYSPIISVIINSNEVKRISIWDPWCHYERLMTISLTQWIKWSFRIGDVLDFKLVVLSDKPDYSRCKSLGCEFPEKKKINIDDICLVDLEVDLNCFFHAL